VNPAACRMLGLEKSELLQMHPEAISVFRASSLDIHLKSIREKGYASWRSKHIRKDGSLVDVEVRATLLGYGGRPILLAIARDISGQKRVEEQLKESEDKYRTLLENLQEGICVVDKDGWITYANPRMAEMLGYSVDEMRGKRLFEFMEEKEIPVAARSLQRKKQGGREQHNLVFRHKGGSRIWTRFRTSPILDPAGTHCGALASVSDITETRKLEGLLIRAQKMEAIGILAGGIAHDFNNLLMGIQGRVSLLLMDASTPHSFTEHLKAVEHYVQSAANLTKQILGFARGGRFGARVTDLNQLVRRSSAMFGRTRKEIRIHFAPQEGLWSVEADPGQIEQVLLNLYLNAWQAMPDAGDLYLETKNMVLDETRVTRYGLESGKFVRVCVRDTGMGMPQSVVGKIFDPFFTTKTMGVGTGLGLFTAYGIITNHRGFIEVSSKEGAGSTFSFFLPVTEKEPDPLSERPQEIAQGVETILLVDDEEMVLEVTKEILEKTGYRVLTARSGRQAVELYKKNLAHIDLVILDMIMPNMGGEATFRALKDIHPEVKVLLSSGYTLEGVASTMLAQGCRGFVQKPFLLQELSKKIREALG